MLKGVDGEPMTDGRVVLARLRALVLAGVTLGVLVGGVGGRLAMLALRLTSPDSVRGVESDDGFEIGTFTLGGSYNLLVLGAAFGVLGAALARMVEPWLIGPRWFRSLTCALGAGAVIGSMLVHADGVDFTLLKPAWFAVALFVAVPALFGALVGPTLALAERPDAWWNQGRRRRWIVPGVAVALFPPVAFVVLLVGLAMAFATAVPLADVARRIRSRALATWTVRSGWLAIAILGLVALVRDARAIV